MISEKMFYGKGDFQKIIQLLIKGYNPNFKDIANKLALVKYGTIFYKQFIKGIDAPDGDGFKIPEEDP